MSRKDKFRYITGKYRSNCLIEAVKAKIKNPKVKIYFCKPRITKGGKLLPHFMWSDGKHDFDFSDSDDEDTSLRWYKCICFKGRIRQFEYGFAKRYSEWCNRQSRKQEETS